MLKFFWNYSICILAKGSRVLNSLGRVGSGRVRVRSGLVRGLGPKKRNEWVRGTGLGPKKKLMGVSLGVGLKKTIMGLGSGLLGSNFNFFLKFCWNFFRNFFEIFFEIFLKFFKNIFSKFFSNSFSKFCR